MPDLAANPTANPTARPPIVQHDGCCYFMDAKGHVWRRANEGDQFANGQPWKVGLVDVPQVVKRELGVASTDEPNAV